MKKYIVDCKSVPGPYEQHDFYVKVFAEDEEDAIKKAYIKLKQGPFFDRSYDMWIFKITL